MSFVSPALTALLGPCSGRLDWRIGLALAALGMLLIVGGKLNCRHRRRC